MAAAADVGRSISAAVLGAGANIVDGDFAGIELSAGGIGGASNGASGSTRHENNSVEGMRKHGGSWFVSCACVVKGDCSEEEVRRSVGAWRYLKGLKGLLGSSQ